MRKLLREPNPGSLGVELETFQSNHEGAVIDRIQQAAGLGPNAEGNGGSEGNVAAIIINPGALTHASVAVRDALLGMGIPSRRGACEQRPCQGAVEAAFVPRRHSYLSDKAGPVICGLGVCSVIRLLPNSRRAISRRRR